MGGKSLNTKYRNQVARAKIAKGFMGKYGEDNRDIEQSQLDNKERICQKCQFKANYPFIRCPECNEQQ
jgi:lipopolysaccharide biosynthesis regulator YciM